MSRLKTLNLVGIPKMSVPYYRDVLQFVSDIRHRGASIELASEVHAKLRELPQDKKDFLLACLICASIPKAPIWNDIVPYLEDK